MDQSSVDESSVGPIPLRLKAILLPIGMVLVYLSISIISVEAQAFCDQPGAQLSPDGQTCAWQAAGERFTQRDGGPVLEHPTQAQMPVILVHYPDWGNSVVVFSNENTIEGPISELGLYPISITPGSDYRYYVGETTGVDLYLYYQSSASKPNPSCSFVSAAAELTPWGSVFTINYFDCGGKVVAVVYDPAQTDWVEPVLPWIPAKCYAAGDYPGAQMGVSEHGSDRCWTTESSGQTVMIFAVQKPGSVCELREIPTDGWERVVRAEKVEGCNLPIDN